MLANGIVETLTELVKSSEVLQCNFAQFLPSEMGHINIKLCRPYWFSQCIKEVAKSGNSYGAQPATGKVYHLCTHDVATTSEADIMQYKTTYYCQEFYRIPNSPVSKARSMLLSSVLYNVLTTVGYTVMCSDIITLSPSDDDKLMFKSALHGPAVQPYLCDCPSSVCYVNIKKYLMDKNLIGEVISAWL